MSDRICSHCGSDRYFSDRFPLINARLQRAERTYTPERARWAKREAELELKIAEQEEMHRYLQQKVTRQRRVLAKLNGHTPLPPETSA